MRSGMVTTNTSMSRHPLIIDSPVADLYLKSFEEITHEEIARLVDDLVTRAPVLRERVPKRKWEFFVVNLAQAIAYKMGQAPAAHDHICRLAAITKWGSMQMRKIAH